MDDLRNFMDRYATAGQPRIDQFEMIAARGFRHLVNLAMPDHADSIANEGEIVTRLGMNYIHLPVPFDAPEPKHLRHFCRLMLALQGDKVFVHCIMNYRVSAFMFHFLTKIEQWDSQRARSPILTRWNMEPAWQSLMTWTAGDIGLQLPTSARPNG